MNTLIAFHGKQEIKDKYVSRVKAHYEADEIIKGRYWEGGKGCAVGCTIEGSKHDRYETELGIPLILAYLEDGLFESMSNEAAMKFPLRFLEAIPVGADLSDVFKHLVVWEWEDKKHGLKNIKEIKDDKELYNCCKNVVKLYKRTLKGEVVEIKEWKTLEELADKIYYAWAWARAWARAVAWARGGARERAWAWAHAWAGARARARARARAWARAEYEKQIEITADKLIDLLKEAPVHEI